MLYSHESFRMYAHAHPRLLLGQRCLSLIGYLHQNNLHFHFSPSRFFLLPQHLPSLENWLQMVNLKMDSKVPKATHLSNWKRHKDEREPALQPARKWQDERTHNKFPRATRRRPAKEERLASTGGLGSSTSRPQHLYHKSPQSSHGSFQSVGVRAVEKSHGLSQSAGLSYFTREQHRSLSISLKANARLWGQYLQNLTLSPPAERLFLNMLLPRSLYRLRIQSSFILRYYICSFFCQHQFKKYLFWVCKCCSLFFKATGFCECSAYIAFISLWMISI